MTPLERRYRRALRLLPAHYRRDWEEDMVETFMNAAEDERDDNPGDDPGDDELAGFRHPTMGELAAVTALAVRLRVAAPATPGATARSITWGEALRRVALLGLLAPAALVTVELLVALAWPLLAAPPPGADASTARPALGDFGPHLGWVLAYLTLAGGWRRTALVVAPATWVAVVLMLVVWAVGLGVLPATLTVEAVALAVPVLALLAWHSDARPPSRRWLLALPAAVAVSGLAMMSTYLGVPVMWDRAGLLCLTVVVAAVLVHIRGRRHPDPVLPWLLALAVLAPVAVVCRSVLVVQLLPLLADQPELQLLVATGAAQALGAAAITATTWVLVRRHTAALPTTQA